MGRFANRNKPCNCGSGKKFKRCCQDNPPIDSIRRKLYHMERQPDFFDKHTTIIGYDSVGANGRMVKRKSKVKVAAVLAAVAALGA